MKNKLLEQISVLSRWCVWSTGIGYHMFFREGYPGLIGLPETYLRKESDPTSFESSVFQFRVLVHKRANWALKNILTRRIQTPSSLQIESDGMI